MQLAKGARVGPYEIVAPLGAGGMGEVYRARDTRLGRSVAIKVIAHQISGDPKRQIRFQREAKAISSLNHPNICALYDIGEVPDDAHRTRRQYIVMEYLEGETLEDRLRNGPMPIDQVLRCALEIAGALETAHQNQILHRDLKPSNIMITKTGARLFDFGLAKFLGGGSSAPSMPVCGPADKQVSVIGSRSGSTAEKPITMEGSVVGTPEYISPEQLQGREPDARTDIFSFGVCLYQMVTGRKPFQGKTYARLMAAILEDDPPPVSGSQPSPPASLEWLIKNCLAKDPDERIQTMHDVKLELKRIADEIHVSAPAESAARFQPRNWVYWSAALTTALIVIAIVLTWQQTKTTTTGKQAIRRFTISLPANAPLAEGPFEKLAVSPDGTRIAYVGGNEPARLYLYSMDKLETKPLPGTEGARGPFFSPDGQWIAFYTVDEGLKKVAVGGGMPVLLSADRDLRGASWASDDTIVFAEVSSMLRRISASGGRSELLTAVDAAARWRWPSFLPGGDLLFTAADFSGDYENAKLAFWSPRSGKTKIILNGGTYGRYASGHLIYLRSQTLFAVPFDLHTKKVTGAPIPIASDVDSYLASGLAQFAVSSDASIFYIPRRSIELQRELVWVDRSGKSTPVTTARRPYENLTLSPDGKRLLVTLGVDPRLDIWIYDIEQDSWSQLTTTADNQNAIWSPDGKRIAFSSNRQGGFDLYVMAADGSPPTKITARKSWDFPSSWSPDGKVIAVTEYYRTTFDDIFTVAPMQGAVPTPLITTPSDERDPVFSPDGRWMAYGSNESGRDEIYVMSYPPSGRKWQISMDGGTNPAWRKDGRELFYRNGNKMMVVSTTLTSELSATKPRFLFEGAFENYDVTADGQHFVMIKSPPQSPRTQINVVLGLFGAQPVR